MKEQQKQQNRNDNILGPRMSGFQKDESSDPLVGLVGDLNNDQIQQNLQDDDNDDLTHGSGRLQAGYTNKDKEEPRGGSGGSGHSGGSGGSNNQDMSEFKYNGQITPGNGQ